VAETVRRPLVSVLVPTYNRPDLLRRALASIRRQTYRDIEIVVVNDAGRDIAGVLAGLDLGAGIRHVRHAENRGIAAARNSGLAVARGDIIAYLDDDDAFLPDHVATLVSALQGEGVAFAYTEAEFVTEGVVLGEWRELERSRPYEQIPYSRERLHVANFIPVNTWGHWRSILARTGNFDESLGNHEDWEFILRCARTFHLTQVRKLTAVVYQRSQPDNIMRRERPRFHDTFQRIYAMHDDLGDPRVAVGRRNMLAQLRAEEEEPGPSA
jgi:glycosyltransferase involved in cell wall biosynthesis